MVSNVNDATSSAESSTQLISLGVIGVWMKRLSRCQWLYYTLVLVIFFAMGHVAGATQNQQSFLKARSISAQKYELRRADGKIGALLVEGRRGETLLMFFDQKGHSRLTMGLTENGAPSILLLGEDQRPKIGLMVTPVDGDPTVFLCDDSGDHVGSLSVSKGLGSHLRIGKAGRGGISVRVSPEGSTFVDFWDRANESRILLSVRDNAPCLSLMDKDHVVRATLRILQDGSPKFSLFDRKDRERLIVLTDRDGIPSIRFIDPDHNAEKKLTADLK